MKPINPKLCQLSFKPKQSLGADCAGWALVNDTEHSRRSERKGRRDAKIAFILLLPIFGKEWRKLGAHSFDGGEWGGEEEEERSSKPGGPRSCAHDAPLLASLSINLGWEESR